jgi:hypothetical protein
MNEASRWYAQMSAAGINSGFIQSHSMFNPVMHSQWMSMLTDPVMMQSMSPMINTT